MTRRPAKATFLALAGALAGREIERGSPLTSSADVPILVFEGRGSSRSDVAAVETILESHRLTYSSARSFELDAMSAAHLQRYRLLIVPGGNFETMGRALAPSTAAKVRGAVQGGLSYLGICAGAFLAGSTPNGFDLTSGVQFHFYSAEARGIRKAPVTITAVGSPPLDQYWEDGPELSNWGAVVASYPDGTPAVVEGSAGRGRVLLVGVHPEAPENWRTGMAFKTPTHVDHEYAATLVRAALDRTRLAHD